MSEKITDRQSLRVAALLCNITKPAPSGSPYGVNAFLLRERAIRDAELPAELEAKLIAWNKATDELVELMTSYVSGAGEPSASVH
jgi:hypothetical protein